MSKYNQAADALKRYAVKYESLMAAAAELEALGSMDQAAKEAQAALKSAKAELETNINMLADAKAAVAAAKADAKKVSVKADEQAMAKLQEADQKAQAIIDGANAQAGKIKGDADAEASRQLSAIAGKVASLTSTKVGLEQDIASLNHAVEAKRIEAEDLEKRLTKAQASIAKLLG
jgi:chromosome segregation ATPase